MESPRLGAMGVRVRTAEVTAGWVELETPYGVMRGERHDGPEFATPPVLPVAHTVTLRQQMGDPSDPGGWLTWLEQASVQSRSVGQEELAAWGNTAAPLELGGGSAGVGVVCLAAYEIASEVLLGSSEAGQRQVAWSTQQIEETRWAMEAIAEARARQRGRVHPVEERLSQMHLVHSMNVWRLTDPVISQSAVAQHLMRELADQEWSRASELRETVLAALEET